MRYWLKVLFTPTCWIQNDRYSEQWDKRLSWLLTSGARFENIAAHTSAGMTCGLKTTRTRHSLFIAVSTFGRAEQPSSGLLTGSSRTDWK